MTRSTRRQFLASAGASASAAALSSLGRVSLRAAQTPAAPAIVDFHAHWVGPHVVELLRAREREAPRPPQGAAWFDIDARLRDMDSNLVRRQVLAWVGGSFDGALPPAEARPL